MVGGGLGGTAGAPHPATAREASPPRKGGLYWVDKRTVIQFILSYCGDRQTWPVGTGWVAGGCPTGGAAGGEDEESAPSPRAALAAMSMLGKIILSLPGVRPAVGRIARMYQASVGAELKRYGLRYDDLLNEHEPEVQRAISQLSPLESELRNKRLKRAFDLDVKKTYLPADLQAKEDVWNPYLRKRVDALKRDRLERQTYD
jgi:ubiquinol-cytochrome c reductase subunit 7